MDSLQISKADDLWLKGRESTYSRGGIESNKISHPKESMEDLAPLAGVLTPPVARWYKVRTCHALLVPLKLLTE